MAELSVTEVEREIRRLAAQADEVRVKALAEAEGVKDYARDISPVETGDYAAHWHIDPRRRTVNGLPAFKLVNDSEIAEKIEFGTGEAAGHHPRSQGGSSPEFAIRAKVAAHFGGTEESITI